MKEQRRNGTFADTSSFEFFPCAVTVDRGRGR